MSKIVVEIPSGKYCKGCPFFDGWDGGWHSHCEYFDDGINGAIYRPGDDGRWEKSVACRAAIKRFNKRIKK